jgi:hypothetical protein
MPTDGCLRSDDNQRVSAPGPKLPGGHPKEFVEDIHSSSGMPTLEDGELLPQSEILQ